MKKIKIIDLLVKVLNDDEVPLLIRYKGLEYSYEKYKNDYLLLFANEETHFFRDTVSNDLTFDICFLSDEVEIIEEDKTNKIEKIDVTIKYLSNNLNDCVLEDISDIQIKLNEVIDAVNNKLKVDD